MQISIREAREKLSHLLNAVEQGPARIGYSHGRGIAFSAMSEDIDRIAASGMVAGGRVVNYLKRMLNDERHDVLFIGYQAQGIPGQAIQRYGPSGGWVKLDGQRIDIRAQVHRHRPHAGRHTGRIAARARFCRLPEP